LAPKYRCRRPAAQNPPSIGWEAEPYSGSSGESLPKVTLHLPFEDDLFENANSG
ncbi:unnamed protein product, partial [Amoebophrya sp. A25]